MTEGGCTELRPFARETVFRKKAKGREAPWAHVFKGRRNKREAPSCAFLRLYLEGKGEIIGGRN